MNIDIEKRRYVLRIGYVLEKIGGIMMGEEVIMIVEEKWKEMKRMMRIGEILVMIWERYMGGEWSKERGEKVFKEEI